MLAGMSPLQTSVVASSSGPVLKLTGEADATCATQLRELVVSHMWPGGVRLIVDVSELAFLDSAALQVLIVAAKLLREDGGELVLSQPREPVLRVLGLMGADQVIRVQHADDAGLATAAGGGRQPGLPACGRCNISERGRTVSNC